MTRTQAATLIELQTMIAWEEVPRTSSSADASAEVSAEVLVEELGVGAGAGESELVDIGDRRRESGRRVGRRVCVGVGFVDR